MSIKDRPRLGRGMRGLLSTPVVLDASAPTSASGSPDGLRPVPIHLIDPNPAQPRTAIDPAALAELVASVRQAGVLQPILLRPVGDRYQLVAGQRRLEAARQAGLTEIPAVIRADATDETQAEWALIENIHRQDLNPIERARAYKSYLDRFNLTHAAGAQRLGEERTVISNFLRLLDLNPGVQDLVVRGLLSAGHAKVLAGLTDPAAQDALANRAIAENLSVRKLEEAATAPAAGPATTVETPVAGHTRTLVAKSPHILELETELSRKVGTRVRIFPSAKKNTGKIVIQYFSLDEFDRIVEKF